MLGNEKTSPAASSLPIRFKSSLPPKTTARVQAQRERILKAAHRCFIAQGIHAARMSSVAKAAGMSQGLIYRYFSGKSEIALAVLQRALDRALEILNEESRSDSVAALFHRIRQEGSGESDVISGILLLEMYAEATRNPDVAVRMTEFETTFRASMLNWLMRDKAKGGHGLDLETAQRRVVILQCLLEGLKIEETRSREKEKEIFAAALDEILTLLFPQSSKEAKALSS